MLPADQVEAFESLVDEIEQMPAIGIDAIRRGRDQKVGQGRRRRPGGNRREEGALGRLPVPHPGPMPQPPLEHGQIGLTGEGSTIPPRRLALTVRGHPAGAMEQGEVSFLLRQHRQQVAKGRKDRQADTPAVPVLEPEERDLPDDLGGWHVRRQLAPHGLGDDQVEIVGQALLQAPTPMSGWVGMAEDGLHPHLAGLAHLDRAGRHVVGPEIEGAAAGEIEPGMVPVAGQDPVCDAAALQRETHVRAAVVEREDASLIVDEQDRRMPAVHDEPALGLQFVEAAGPHKLRGQRIHRGLRPAAARIMGCGELPLRTIPDQPHLR